MKDLFGNELQVGDKVMVLHISSYGINWTRYSGGMGTVESIMLGGMEWDMRVVCFKAEDVPCKRRGLSGDFYMKWYEVVKLDENGAAMMPSDMTVPKALQLCREKSRVDPYVLRGTTPCAWAYMKYVKVGAELFRQEAEIPF